MTYNFDPDRWYDNQLALLEHRRTKGGIDLARFEEELERLGQRYDQMLERLNVAFELPPPRTKANG